MAATYGETREGSYHAFDAVGRERLKYQRLNTTNYQIQASYNKAGAVTSQSYPSGRVVTYNYYGEASFPASAQKPAGKLAKFSGNLGDGLQRTYSEQVLYTAAGQLTQEQFVTNTRLYHNRHFTNRGLLYDVRLGTGTGVDRQTAEWTWNREAIRLFYSSDYTYGNGGVNVNGNVYRVDHFIPDNESASNWAMPIDYYWYDSLNRIEGVTEVSDSYQNGVYQSLTSFSQQFVYDRYGNRTINQTATWGAGINKKDFTVDVSNNRLGVPGRQSGVMSYDAVGNLINDTYTGEGSRSYDAENRMTSAVGSNGSNSYGYDGEGKRVRRILPGQEWWQVYGIGSELIAEYLSTQPAVVSKEYGYRNGELVVVVPCDSTVRWMVSDHLGTPRIEADVSGSLSGVKRHDYLPFGEELVVGMGDNSVRTGGRGYGVDCVRQRFDAYERDSETGLDFAQARYFSSVQGRFTSTDPLYIEMKRLPYPQAWNLYAHTRNNPLKYVDPDGLEIKVTCADGKLCDETVANLNNRKNAQFKVELKDGKLAVVGKVDASKLDKSERQLYNAITDTKNTTELQIRAGSDAIDFAQYAKPGLNIIDAADVRQLNKVDQRLSGEVIAHEALEAYAGVAEGKSNFTDAHRRANEFFGQAVIATPSIGAVPKGANPTFGGEATYNFQRLGVQVKIQKLFISPQPAESLPNNWERIRGNLRVIPPK